MSSQGMEAIRSRMPRENELIVLDLEKRGAVGDVDDAFNHRATP